MYIESIENEVIQEGFDLAQDDWDDNLAMLTLTFDYKPKEQTLNMIKSFTKDYISNLN